MDRATKRPSSEVGSGSSSSSTRGVNNLNNGPSMSFDTEATTPIPEVLPPSQPYQPVPQAPHSLDDWDYKMRHEMQEITPGLFLGPLSVASKKNLGYLKNNGITHIVLVRHETEARIVRPHHEEHFKYMIAEFKKDMFLIPLAKRVAQFINNESGLGGGGSTNHNEHKVLVYGTTGMDKSASIVIAYVMSHYGISLKASMDLVRGKRFAVSPSGWMMAQLKEYEPMYQAVHDSSQPRLDGDPSQGAAAVTPTLKRKVGIGDDDDDEEDEEMPEDQGTTTADDINMA